MDWFENDQFWVRFAPIMFDAERWEDTPWEVDNLLKLTGLHAGGTVLDSCCGVGRHALEFARRGFKVTGVDRTAPYLDAAAESADSENLDIEFVLQDVRSFSRPAAFDLAMNLFTSFGFFSSVEEEKQYITSIHTNLTGNGIFVIDVNGKETLARDFKLSEEYEKDGYTVRGEYLIEEDFSLLNNTWSISRDGEEYSFQFSHRIYSAVELKQLLLECGFSKVEVYGGFDGRPYNHEAIRLITVAHK